MPTSPTHTHTNADAGASAGAPLQKRTLPTHESWHGMSIEALLVLQQDVANRVADIDSQLSYRKGQIAGKRVANAEWHDYNVWKAKAVTAKKYLQEYMRALKLHRRSRADAIDVFKSRSGEIEPWHEGDLRGAFLAALRLLERLHHEDALEPDEQKIYYALKQELERHG